MTTKYDASHISIMASQITGNVTLFKRLFRLIYKNESSTLLGLCEGRVYGDTDHYGSDNGLLLDGTNPLCGRMLIYQQ